MDKKKLGLVSTVSGTISSIVGLIGITSVVSCGGICVGPLVAILGVGLAGFFHKYSIIFIVIGGLLFLFGIFLIIRKRRINCCTSTYSGEIKKQEG